MYGVLCLLFGVIDPHGYGKLELRTACLGQCFIYTNRVRYNNMGEQEAIIMANLQSNQIKSNKNKRIKARTSGAIVVSPSYIRTSSPVSLSLTAEQLEPHLRCRGSRVPRTCAVARLCQHPHSRQTAGSVRCGGRLHASTRHRPSAASRL